MEERLKKLNPLVKRYNDFGLKAPYFIPQKDGTYLFEYKGFYCYLSEYLDYELAEHVMDKCVKEIQKARVIFVARFAEAYKNIDLVDTMSMHSIFELSPYDQSIGMDGKQESFNILIHDLEEAKEFGLADRLKVSYERDRRELLSFYKELPRCVFQGDENFSNLCVDENNHIIGLFDFNMSGTDVIANYLTYIAFQGNFFYTDEMMEQYSAQEILDMLMKAFRESTSLIKQYYNFNDMELKAYKLYARILMISAPWNQEAFSEYLKNDKYKEKIIELLYLIEGVNLN